ncbi:sensor histidine kinase [Solobacterium moorei]|nr:sensor histidine kinase [Solobacterium moorei]
MTFNTYEATVKSETKEISASFQSFLDGIDKTLSTLSSHQEFLSSSDSESIYNTLYQITNPYRNYATFSIYDQNGNCMYATCQLANRPTYWGILHALNHSSIDIIKQVNSEDNQIVLNIATKIQNNNDTIGYIVSSIHSQDFTYLFSNQLSNDEGFGIISKENEPIYINSILETSGIFDKLHYAWISNSKYDDYFNDYYITIQNIENTGFKQIVVHPKVLSSSMMNRMYLMVGLLAVLSFIVCIIVAQKTTTSFTQPINQMNQAMKQVQEGKLDTSIPVLRNDEFGVLSQNFNVMTQELSNFLEQKIETQRKLADIQIAMMQAQLNPHFLYNTLDTIKWMAKSAKVEPISQLSQKLARILRTSIVKEQFITIGEEFQICSDYGEIQNIRFQGKYQFLFDCPKDLLSYKIPKLIIQPLVENAIIHGLRMKETGIIKVFASKNNDAIILSVQDNGIGIDDEMMKFINTHQWKQIDGHIGMYNVDSILRLHYGVNSGLHAQRLEEGGTLIQITLPYKEASCTK